MVRYWLQFRGSEWREVTLEDFIAAERAAGFIPKHGCGPIATGGFGTDLVNGRVTDGDITQEKYGWEPEFFEVAGQ